MILPAASVSASASAPSSAVHSPPIDWRTWQLAEKRSIHLLPVPDVSAATEPAPSVIPPEPLSPSSSLSAQDKLWLFAADSGCPVDRVDTVANRLDQRRQRQRKTPPPSSTRKQSAAHLPVKPFLLTGAWLAADEVETGASSQDDSGSAINEVGTGAGSQNDSGSTINGPSGSIAWLLMD